MSNSILPHYLVCLWRASIGLALTCGSLAAYAESARNVADLSLEDLMNIEVTSASRKAQRLSDTAAAVFVITGDDIRRSGASSIPEILQMVPGVQVGRLASNRWAVTVRGFDGRFANKLLVLRDGRSIYSPLFSGVLWEEQDMNLEDIDSIEVIRGPGAALWGANAVNGVINIITKKAKDTQGAMVSAGVGTLERAALTARYGGMMGDETRFRIYAKAVDRSSMVDMNGERANDSSGSDLAGFRIDSRLRDDSRLTFSGESRKSRGGDIWATPVLTAPYSLNKSVRQHNSGSNLLGRYERNLEEGSAITFQAFVDHSELDIDGSVGERRNTIDFDFQHRLHAGERNDIIWGLNVRNSRDSLTGGGYINFAVPSRTFRLASVYVQDEITIVPDKLRLTVGARFEHNNFSGSEPQANVRVFWRPDAMHSLWTAASRATRTPSRGETDAIVQLSVTPPLSPQNPTPFPMLLRSVPNVAQGLVSEHVDSLEFGYRAQLGTRLSLDAALFANRYRRLRSASIVSTGLEFAPAPYLVTTIAVDNLASAETRGIELALDWRPYSWWRLQPSYARFRMTAPVTGDPVRDSDGERIAGNSPRHQFSLRSQFDVAERQRLDLWLHYVSSLTYANIPGRWDLDIRYAWRPRKDLELAVTGQNLLHKQLPQFKSDNLASIQLQVQRSAQLNAKWQF